MPNIACDDKPRMRFLRFPGLLNLMLVTWTDTRKSSGPPRTGYDRHVQPDVGTAREC